MVFEKKNTKKWQKTLQFLAAYLVAAWTFLQFVDWALIRYKISPHWVDILLWVFIGIIPSLIIYLNNRERINNKVLKLREKIIFPLNIVLIAVVIYFGFGNSDLGSTTKEVSIKNDLGEIETQIITKEEFRIGLPVFNFQQKTKDSVTAWLGSTINKLIKLDLEQDKNFSPTTRSADNTMDKVNSSTVFFDYYLDGTYEVKDSTYYITSILRNAKNGKEIKRKELEGKDFFSLIDQISVFIKESLIISGEAKDRYIDIDVKDITTTSMKALELWAKRDYESAVKEDKSFSLAYYDNAIRRTTYSHGELEEKYLIDNAYKYKSKLPSQLQYEILIYKNIAYEQWKDAEELIKYQLEIAPNNIMFNELLYLVYSETKNIDAYYNHALERYTKNKNRVNAPKYFEALILKGENKKAENLIKTFDLLSPDIEQVKLAKAFAFLMSGDIKEAKETYKKIKLLWPKESYYQDFVDDYIERKEKGIDYNFDIKSSEGIYRSTGAEQQVEYFTKNNFIYVRYKNQHLKKVLIFSNNELLKLSEAWVSGNKHVFERDSLGNIFRVKSNQFNRQNLTVFYYYKETDEIRKAYTLLKSGQYEGLDKTFDALIKKHPQHWFLKDALQHINYINSIDKPSLEKQLKKIEGNYGTRKFSLENNKLFYKRDNLTKVEILPISKDRYISLSRYATNYGFEFLPNNKTASFAWSYNEEKSEWVKDTSETNYLLKN